MFTKVLQDPALRTAMVTLIGDLCQVTLDLYCVDIFRFWRTSLPCFRALASWFCFLHCCMLFLYCFTCLPYISTFRTKRCLRPCRAWWYSWPASPKWRRYIVNFTKIVVWQLPFAACVESVERILPIDVYSFFTCKFIFIFCSPRVRYWRALLATSCTMTRWVFLLFAFFIFVFFIDSAGLLKQISLFYSLSNFSS